MEFTPAALYKTHLKAEAPSHFTTICSKTKFSWRLLACQGCFVQYPACFQKILIKQMQQEVIYFSNYQDCKK